MAVPPDAEGMGVMAQLTTSYTIKTRKDGTVEVVKKRRRKSVSQQIADRNNPKRTYRKASP